MDEWIRKIAEVLGFNEMDPDLFALGLLINVVIVAIVIYKYVAIKHNLPLPNWLKNLDPQIKVVLVVEVVVEYPPLNSSQSQR